MSAFPESGRSDHLKLSEIRVRFRPQADLATQFNKATGAERY